MTKRVLITSALPYANGPIHFGHISGAYLPADCFARYQRLKGADVLYLCGSDEHGVAITLSAEMAGRTPKQHIDIYHELIKDLFSKVNISFDHYSRTTWEQHAETTKQFFFDLLENGYIEERVTDQLFSEADNRFLADRYVVGTCPKCKFEAARGDECTSCGASYEATDLINPRSKLTNAPLSKKATKHWFLLFDKFKEQLQKWIKAKEWKPNVINFVSHYIDDLKPRAITRDSDWGIPVPLDGAEGKVFYVWFDAPIGYISAAKEWAEKKGDPDAWKPFWLDESTKLVNFIGKDNIPFHAIFFPAMVMGQNQPYKLVDDLPANEFLNLEGKQFSKSSGWTIDLEHFFKHFTADQIRYTMAANAPETSDSEFSWKDFQTRCNSELLGKYGNLANRTLTFLKRLDSKVPPQHELRSADKEFLENIKRLEGEISLSYASYHLRRASNLVMELCQLGNVYFDSKKPWKLIKDPKCQDELETTLNLCLYCLKVLALVSSPILPEAAQKLWVMLGQQGELAQLRWNTIIEEPMEPKTPLPQPEILFTKIEDPIIEEQLAKLKELSQAKDLPQIKELISFEDFGKIDLRIASIISAEKVKKSKKLLKIEVDLGSEKRTVVSGISEHYEPEDLVGKQVILVANLKPAKLMGIESQGMILAAHEGKMLKLPMVEGLAPGSSVS
ncbi:MAG: methionine--tRNA ligase [Simkaniaceae bacterium]|nr:methionine--tRNA ligase [Simkaniaceae bacterium]